MEFVNKAIQEFGELLHGLIPDLSALPLVLLFAAVFMGVLVVPQLVKQQNPIKRRLTPAVAARSEDGGPNLRVSASNSAWDQMIAGLEKRAMPTKEKQRTTARLRQLQAGNVGPNAVRNYYAIRVAMSVIFPLTYLALLPFFSRDMTIENILLLGVCAAVLDTRRGQKVSVTWCCNGHGTPSWQRVSVCLPDDLCRSRLDVAGSPRRTGGNGIHPMVLVVFLVWRILLRSRRDVDQIGAERSVLGSIWTLSYRTARGIPRALRRGSHLRNGFGAGLRRGDGDRGKCAAFENLDRRTVGRVTSSRLPDDRNDTDTESGGPADK